MNVQVQPHVTTAQRHLPFECVALVLQGGGALGAYQAGVYEALSEAGIHPDWIAGISIGAINAAIIPSRSSGRIFIKLRDMPGPRADSKAVALLCLHGHANPHTLTGLHVRRHRRIYANVNRD
jgi:hypothetical protein